MVKSFIKDSLIYGIANLLTRGIGFLLIPLYTHLFMPADFGVIDILTVFSSLANVTVALEISQAVARFYSTAETNEQKISFASTSLWFTIVAYTFFLLVVLGASPQISTWLLESSQQQDTFQVAMVSVCASGVFYLVQNQLRWELKPWSFALISTAYTLASLGTAVGLVVVAHSGVIGVFWGQLIGSALGSLLGIIFARRSYRLHFDLNNCWTMLKFSLPLVPSSVAVFVTLYIDRILIKQMMSLSDVGVFGIGYRFASLAGLLMIAFQSSLTPLVYHHYRDANTPTELARIFRYFVGLALLMCLGLGLFAPEILSVVTTPDYYSAASIIAVLAPAVLLFNMYIFAPGLGIAKKTGFMALFNIACAIENTLLNILLIPRFGIVGAASATLLSAVTLFTAYMIASQRYYFVPHRWRPLGIGTFIVSGVVYINTLSTGSFWPWILIKCLVILGVAVVFIAVGLITSNEIKDGWHRLRQVFSASLMSKA